MIETIEAACEVLNRERWRGQTDWFVLTGRSSFTMVTNPLQGDRLYSQDAIAIAQSIEQRGEIERLRVENARLEAPSVEGIAEEILELTPSSATRVRSTWLPMDIAPRDGTPVLLRWRSPYGQLSVVLASWGCWKHRYCSVTKDCHWGSQCDMRWDGYAGETTGWQPVPPVEGERG